MMKNKEEKQEAQKEGKQLCSRGTMCAVGGQGTAQGSQSNLLSRFSAEFWSFYDPEMMDFAQKTAEIQWTAEKSHPWNNDVIIQRHHTDPCKYIQFLYGAFSLLDGTSIVSEGNVGSYTKTLE